jgi:hypothetical protein
LSENQQRQESIRNDMATDDAALKRIVCELQSTIGSGMFCVHLLVTYQEASLPQ